MKQRRSTSLITPILACALLAAWIALSTAGSQVADFSVLIAVLANFIVYTDAADLLLRLYVRRRHTSATTLELSIDLPVASPTSSATGRQIKPSSDCARRAGAAWTTR
jgi:hypothetical protein